MNRRKVVPAMLTVDDYSASTSTMTIPLLGTFQIQPTYEALADTQPKIDGEPGINV